MSIFVYSSYFIIPEKCYLSCKFRFPRFAWAEFGIAYKHRIITILCF